MWYVLSYTMVSEGEIDFTEEEGIVLKIHEVERESSINGGDERLLVAWQGDHTGFGEFQRLYD